MSDDFHNRFFWAGDTAQRLDRTPDGGQQMGDYFAWRQVAGALQSEYEKYGPEGFERRHGVPWEEVERMITEALSNAPDRPQYDRPQYMAPPPELRTPERNRDFMAPPPELRNPPRYRK